MRQTKHPSVKVADLKPWQRGKCKNGHLRTDENTELRPNGPNGMKLFCLDCYEERIQRQNKKARERRTIGPTKLRQNPMFESKERGVPKCPVCKQAMRSAVCRICEVKEELGL